MKRIPLTTRSLVLLGSIRQPTPGRLLGSSRHFLSKLATKDPSCGLCPCERHCVCAACLCTAPFGYFQLPGAKRSVRNTARASPMSWHDRSILPPSVPTLSNGREGGADMHVACSGELSEIDHVSRLCYKFRMLNMRGEVLFLHAMGV